MANGHMFDGSAMTAAMLHVPKGTAFTALTGGTSKGVVKVEVTVP